MSDPFGYGNYYNPFGMRKAQNSPEQVPGAMGGDPFQSPQSKSFSDSGVSDMSRRLSDLKMPAPQQAPISWPTMSPPQNSKFSGWGGGDPISNVRALGQGTGTVETPLRSDLFSGNSQNIGGWDQALKDLQGTQASPWLEDRYRGFQSLMDQIASARAKGISAAPRFDQSGYDQYMQGWATNPDFQLNEAKRRSMFTTQGDWNSYEQMLQGAYQNLYNQFSGGGQINPTNAAPVDDRRTIMRSF